MLRCSSERSVLTPYLIQQIQQQPLQSAAADRGAGTGDLWTAHPPVPIDYALLAQVLHHVPDEDWTTIMRRLLDFQSSNGQLVIILKGDDFGCNRMLERFGAQKFDLMHQIMMHADKFSGFDLKVDQLLATINTKSYEKTEKLARFMMCDRRVDEFPMPPDETDFVNYLATQLWNPALLRGGWDYEVAVCTIAKSGNSKSRKSPPGPCIFNG